MIRLRVLEILEEQGHSKYGLYTRMNLSYQNFNRLVNNQTKSIRYENIEKLCHILNVNFHQTGNGYQKYYFLSVSIPVDHPLNA